MDEVVSEIITKTTDVDPRTNLLAMFALEAQLDKEVEIGDGYEPFVVGSVADLNIKPLLRCDKDINIMSRSRGEIAIPIGCRLPDDEYIRRLNSTKILLYRMEPTQDPGFVRLLTSASLECIPHRTPARFACKQDPNSGIFVQHHKTLPTFASMGNSGSRTRRTFQYHCAVRTNYMKMHENQFVISSDSVKSIPCPFWSSKDFCERPKPHGWPMEHAVNEIARTGCDLVLASDVKVRIRSDTAQWRLTFFRAETLLLQTWTSVQKIVYHLLRHLRKKCLPVACLISSYHIKTLMLWNCEKQSPRYWTANIITISSDLLGRLVKHINDRHLSNYFIPQSNLFEVRTDDGDSFGSSYVAAAATLKPFTRAEVLAKWYLENYIKVAAKQFYGSKSSNLANDLILIEHLDIFELTAWMTTFVDTFLADYEEYRAMEDSLAVNNCIRTLFKLCAGGKLVAGLCRHILDQLPQIDIRSLDFFRSVAFMEFANQTDQFGYIPGADSLGIVVEVLVRSGKINRSDFEQNEIESASSYFKKATSLLQFVKCSSAVDDKLLVALAKAYFWRSLSCADSGAFYCAVNAYLAAIFYQGKKPKLALQCCTLIASKVDHFSCSGHKIQPQSMPIINAVLSTRTSSVETEKQSRCVPNEAECKPPSTDLFTPEAFADCILTKIERDRFDEDAGTSSCFASTSRMMSDKQYISSQFSKEEANTLGSSSSYIASNKTIDIVTLFEKTQCGISNDFSLDVSCKSGKKNSQDHSYSSSPFFSDCEIENCDDGRESQLDVFRSFTSGKSSPLSESENVESSSTNGRNRYRVRSGDAGTDHCKKTMVYARTEFQTISQKCKGDQSLSLEHAARFKNESAVNAERTVHNEAKVVNLANSGREMIYCRDLLSLRIHAPLKMRSIRNADHASKAFFSTQYLRAALNSLTDECDQQDGTEKLTGNDFSPRPYSRVDESVGNERTDFNYTCTTTKTHDSSMATDCPPTYDQLYGSIATNIQQDVVSALVKASVCYMTAFNKALQGDPNLSQHGDHAYPYMALYHFNSGHFQAALEICRDIIGPNKIHSSDAAAYNVICSPPFNLLLTPELRMVVSECSSSGDLMTIDAGFLAAYISIHCLMKLNKPLVEIARMLMLAQALLLRSHETFVEVNSRVFALLRENVLQLHRGVITEDIGNDSLSVLENGVLTTVGIRNEGAGIVLYTERNGGWDNRDYLYDVNENSTVY